MKVKEWIVAIIFIAGLAMAYIDEVGVVGLIGISIMFTIPGVFGMVRLVRWIKNRKLIGDSYYRLNMQNIMLEVFLIINIMLSFRNDYTGRAFLLEYRHNKIVEINNFMEYINSYEGVEKALRYIVILVIIMSFVSIIRKIIWGGRISESKVLLVNGVIIDFEKVKNTEIKDSFWGFSKKITLIMEKEVRTFSIKNRHLNQVEIYLPKILD